MQPIALGRRGRLASTTSRVKPTVVKTQLSMETIYPVIKIFKYPTAAEIANFVWRQSGADLAPPTFDAHNPTVLVMVVAVFNVPKFEPMWLKISLALSNYCFCNS